MSNINIAPVELVLKNTDEHIDIQICDAEGNPVDVNTGSGGNIELVVVGPTSNVLFKDAYPLLTLTGTVTVSAGSTEVIGTNTKFCEELDEGDSITIGIEVLTVDTITSNTRLVLTTPHVAGATDATVTKATRIIKTPGTTGSYYINWGDPAAAANSPNQSETNNTGDFLFRWRIRQATGVETVSVVQVVKVVTVHVLKLVVTLRLQIDKTGKLVDDDPFFPCRTGYSDEMLVQFLEGGLTLINAAQPYPTFSTLDQYPSLFGQVLIDAALLVGIMTQQLFSIDTDIPNYSDQGNAFVLDHFPRLNTYAQNIRDDLKTRIPDLKLHFVKTGSIHIEAGANFRLAQLIQAAPNGSLFRNFFTGII
jgi:hypothetical protein